MARGKGWHEEPHYAEGEGICRIRPRNDPEFPNGAWWDLYNCVYDKESDNPECLRGGTRIGSTDMGGTVSGLFDFDNGSKAIATCTDGKIYEYTASDWTADATGARGSGNDTAATTRWSGCMYYGATSVKNLLILCDGIDAPAKWEATGHTTNLGGGAPATGNFPAPWQGRLWMATGTTLYCSDTNDAEDFTGGENIAIYRGYDGNITGLKPFSQNLFIFKRSSIYRIGPTETFNQSTVKNVSTTLGCVNHNTLQEAQNGNYLVFMSERGPAALMPSNNYAGFRVEQIGQWVKPITKYANKDAGNVAWGLWNGDRQEYYLHYAVGSATSADQGVIANFARNRKPPRWTRFNILNFSAGMMFNEGNTDYLQWIGDDNGRVYQMHVQSEITVDNTPILGRMASKYYVNGAPNHMKNYGWAFVDGAADGAYSVSVYLQMLRTGMQSAPPNTEEEAFSTADSTWGVGKWGEALWGGSGTVGRRIRPSKVARATGMGIITESTRWYLINGNIIASDIRGTNIAA